MWSHKELTLDELLTAPVIKAVMEADAVDPHELRKMLQRVRFTRERASAKAQQA